MGLSLVAARQRRCAHQGGKRRSCNGPLPSVGDPIYGGEGGLSPEEGRAAGGDRRHLRRSPCRRDARRPPRYLQGRTCAWTASGRQADCLLPTARLARIGARPASTPRSCRALSAHGMGRTGRDTRRSLRACDPNRELLDLPAANTYWRAPQPTPSGAAVRSTIADRRALCLGEVATEIAADHNITSAGWLRAWTLVHAAMKAATDRDPARRQQPGKPPAMLWNASRFPAPGTRGDSTRAASNPLAHPAAQQGAAGAALAERTESFGRAKALQLQRHIAQQAGKEHPYLQVLVPPTVARRIGPAWLLVRYGNSPAQRIAFLRTLQTDRLEPALIAYPNRSPGRASPDRAFTIRGQLTTYHSACLTAQTRPSR